MNVIQDIHEKNIKYSHKYGDCLVNTKLLLLRMYGTTCKYDNVLQNYFTILNCFLYKFEYKLSKILLPKKKVCAQANKLFSIFGCMEIRIKYICIENLIE